MARARAISKMTKSMGDYGGGGGFCVCFEGCCGAGYVFIGGIMPDFLLFGELGGGGTRMRAFFLSRGMEV